MGQKQKEEKLPTRTAGPLSLKESLALTARSVHLLLREDLEENTE